MNRGAPPIAVDVAVVNWNTSEAALAGAASYLASSGVEARVTIVDNDSQPPQHQLLKERLPAGATLELSEENLGYGRAANLALGRGEAPFVCVSNADVVAEPAALGLLVEEATREPRAGMVGPVFAGDTDRYHARLPSGAAMLGRIFAGSFMRGAVPMPAPGQVREVGQPSGACFLLRRQTWERIGGFDEGFFLWYEDVDLAKRLAEAGFRNLVVGSARVAHVGARSFRQVDRRRQQEIRLASVSRYIRKHHPAMAPVSTPLLRLSARLRAGR